MTKRLVLLTAWGVLALLLLAAGPGTAPGRESRVDTRTLRSDRLDGTFEDLPADIAPVTVGAGITIRLASPRHRLEVLEHRLDLRPAANGQHDALFHARLRGTAQLVADVDFGGLPGRLEDSIGLPEQDTEIAARVAIDRLADGYQVTAVRLPPHVELAIDSKLGGSLVSLCRAVAIFTLGGDACDGLDRALSVVRLPLPAAGEKYHIADADLTESERRQLEQYLAAQKRGG